MSTTILVLYAVGWVLAIRPAHALLTSGDGDINDGDLGMLFMGHVIAMLLAVFWPIGLAVYLVSKLAPGIYESKGVRKARELREREQRIERMEHDLGIDKKP